MSVGIVQSHRADRLLLDAIRHPDGLPTLPVADWDLLIRVARRVRLLGRLEAELSRMGLLSEIPARAASQLRAARNVIRHRGTLVAWEVNRIQWALKGVDAPIILLKGAAYVLADLPPARGRIFADVDLLVPEGQIQEIEEKLVSRGWMKLTIQPYDDRYYRVWMHEIPPLRHRERGTEIDLHHRILPRTSRLKSDPAPLFDAARPLEGGRLHVLAPAEMVLHSLVHLLLECDPREGLRLRDLLDVHLLLEHFGREDGFWADLVPRARQLGLERPLFYGLRFVRRFFDARIPESVLTAADEAKPHGPLLWLMDRLVALAILPGHPDHRSRKAALARSLLYLRAHWMRMPPFLLARHLAYKAYLRIRGQRGSVDLTKLDLRQQ
jgi:hypothetical protein